jgi:excisionase family DNA binding protein
MAKLLTTAEVAEALGVSVDTVRDAVHRGVLTPAKVTRRKYRFDPAAVEAAIGAGPGRRGRAAPVETRG